MALPPVVPLGWLAKLTPGRGENVMRTDPSIRRGAGARALLGSAAILAAMTVTSRARAGTTWSGLGANGNWSTAGNWTPSGQPPNDGSANILFAGGTGLNSSVDSRSEE